MSFSIQRYVSEMLTRNPDKKFTAREIANWIVTNYPRECEEKRKKSTAKVVPLDTPEALVQQIVAEIGSQRKIIQ